MSFNILSSPQVYLTGIETGALNWDPDLHYGSETAYNHILRSTLSFTTFSIIVTLHSEGGARRKNYINSTTKGIDSEDKRPATTLIPTRNILLTTAKITTIQPSTASHRPMNNGKKINTNFLASRRYRELEM